MPSADIAALRMQPPSLALEDCPFETVFVDVTHRCNMGCRNCYIPNRSIPDLDRAWINEALARLPPKRYIRLVGAEPTMRDDLFDLVRDVRRHHHHAIVMTNGLKLIDRAYVRELKQAGTQIIYLSMNGGFDDEQYLALDGMRCAERKRLAFENLRAEHVFTSIGIILARDRNEHVLAPLFDACLASRNVREFHVRSIGAMGRYMKGDVPFTLEELRDEFVRATGRHQEVSRPHERTATAWDFIVERIRVQLTCWPDLGSETRGRLTPDGRVSQFFEHAIANEGGY